MAGIVRENAARLALWNRMGRIGHAPPANHAIIGHMASIPTVYGIANCDTVRKARAWLQAQGVAYVWHDFKKQGVPAVLLAQWLQQLGRDALINRKGTTWRQLDAAVQAGVTDEASAAALMLAQPSVIKRPLVDWGQGRVTLGFDPQQWMQMQAATNAPD
jgi:arsenate reductase